MTYYKCIALPLATVPTAAIESLEQVYTNQPPLSEMESLTSSTSSVSLTSSSMFSALFFQIFLSMLLLIIILQ